MYVLIDVISYIKCRNKKRCDRIDSEGTKRKHANEVQYLKMFEDEDEQEGVIYTFDKNGKPISNNARNQREIEEDNARLERIERRRRLQEEKDDEEEGVIYTFDKNGKPISNNARNQREIEEDNKRINRLQIRRRQEEKELRVHSS